VPSAQLPYTNPFSTGSRPYLTLMLIGINQQRGNVIGLVDSGADTTQLPLGYASLMGYDQTTLSTSQIGTAGAVTQVFQAKQPCEAFVVGLAGVVFKLAPVFSPSSPYVLWGRSDFMAAFGVSIYEARQEFELHW